MKSGLLGGFLQLPRQNWYNPFLSSWDRDQENSAFVGQELFRQAYSAPPDLYRPSSEQAKRADPNMTDEGHTNSAWVVGENLPAALISCDSVRGQTTTTQAKMVSRTTTISNVSGQDAGS